jgi:hypothetical protein
VALARCNIMSEDGRIPPRLYATRVAKCSMRQCTGEDFGGFGGMPPLGSI